MSVGEIWRRIAYFLRRDQIDREIEEEIRLHRDLRGDEGPSFGNEALVKEEARAQWQWRPIEELRHDFRYAVRMLRRTPAFTVVAILSLALGIGANTAIFSLVDALMLKTMPVESPEQLRLLVWSGQGGPSRSFDGYRDPDRKLGVDVNGSFAPPLFRLFREHVEQFTDLIGFSDTEINVTIDGQTGVTSGAYVSGNYFPVLGVGTLAGRSILPEDDAPGKAQVAVISYRYWNQRFGLDPTAVGKKITIDQKPVTIIGVLPQSFLGVTLGRECEIYLPLTFVAEVEPASRAFHQTDKWWIEIIGRLRPGVSDQEAESALTAATRGWVDDIGTTSAYTKLPQVHIFPGARGVERLRRYVEPKVYVLSGFVGLVLLIACVNLANLLLARGSTRRREMAIRLSIGAGKFRLIRQLLTESILLAGIGGLLGLVIAGPLSQLVLQMVSGAQTPLLDLRLDPRAVAFTFVLSLLTGALFGTLPALRSARVDLTPALKNSGTTSGLPRLRLGRSLVVAQVGLSLILLVGAGLYMRTLTALLTTDLGFVTEHVITFRADASRIGYKSDQLVDVYDRLRRAISAMPGVESVAMSNHGLITSSRRASTVLVPGYVGKPGEDRGTYILLCSDSFLSTMQIPLIAGRDLSPSDTAASRKVIVVNESFVKKFFPSVANPLGQIVHFGDAKQPPLEIVGLVRNARYATVRGDYPATAYQPYTQVVPGRMTYAVRTTLPLASAGPAIRRAVSGIDSLIPVTELRTQEQVISRHLATERLFAILVSALGIIAALLAAIGLYGVMAYTMTRRTAEIGIRMALGAERRQVQWLILRDAVVMVILGLAIGVPAAFALTELVKNQLYGIKPNDAVSFVFATALMIAVAGLAAWLPARRAARVDPIVALKYE